MTSGTPHFLLFSEAGRAKSGDAEGRWHFLLEPLTGGDSIEASDVEPAVEGERLELLAVVRGLEALDQPSRVTLVTPSRRVSRGFRYGLAEWKSNGWRWERFGRQVPVKNHDLWRRIDHAMRFHKVECRTWRIDSAHEPARTSPSPRVRPASRSTSNWMRSALSQIKNAIGSVVDHAPLAAAR